MRFQNSLRFLARHKIGSPFPQTVSTYRFYIYVLLMWLEQIYTKLNNTSNQFQIYVCQPLVQTQP